MATTYYYHGKPPCSQCRRPFPPLKIGLSAVGWVFMLNTYPKRGITNLEDWCALWYGHGEIRTDDGRQVTPTEMLRTITERTGRPWDEIQVFPGYESESHFHAVHSTYRGPKGLLRSHKAVPGPGTWDLCAGKEPEEV